MRFVTFVAIFGGVLYWFAGAQTAMASPNSIQERADIGGYGVRSNITTYSVDIAWGTQCCEAFFGQAALFNDSTSQEGAGNMGVAETATSSFGFGSCVAHTAFHEFARWQIANGDGTFHCAWYSSVGLNTTEAYAVTRESASNTWDFKASGSVVLTQGLGFNKALDNEILVQSSFLNGSSNPPAATLYSTDETYGGGSIPWARQGSVGGSWSTVTGGTCGIDPPTSNWKVAPTTCGTSPFDFYY